MRGAGLLKTAALAGLTLATLAQAAEPAAPPPDASQALFEQAFAKRRKSATPQISLPARLDGREIGSIDAQIRSDGVWLAREALARLLKTRLLPSVQAALAQAASDGPWISAQTLKPLGLEALYSAQSITLELSIPLTLRQTQVLQVDGRSPGHGADAGETLQPETWSLIANTRWVLSRSQADAGSVNSGRAYLEAAQRMGQWVLEGAGSASLSQTSGASSREFTRLVRDWPAQALRLTLGDFSPPARPGLPALAAGGLQLSRRFSLNPGINPQSQPGEQLALPAGAAVDVTSNGFVSRTLQLAPGVYALRDIPVFSGANAVELLIAEPGGRQSVRRFDYFFDAALLAPGLIEYELSLGKPSQSGLRGPLYSAGQTVSALSWRQGLRADVTAGATLQLRKTPAGTVRIAQADALWATGLGTLAGYVTGNQHPDFSGRSASLQWRWQSATRRSSGPAPWSWSALAQTTRNGSGHAALMGDSAQTASRDSGLRLSALSPDGLSISASAAQQTGATPAASARSLGLALRKSLNRQWSLEASLSQQHNGAGLRQFSAALSLRYSGERQADGASHRAALAYQSQERLWQANGEATGIATVAGADAPWSLLTGAASSPAGTQTSLSAALQTSRAHVSAQLIRSRTPFGASGLAEASLATALLASRNGLSLSRPVSDSAALIVPRRGYENLSIFVDPMLDRSAAASDRFGPPVLTDLNAYTPREIQLDVANLPPGYGLGLDRPWLSPAHRSLTLVPLGSDASVQISGTLHTGKGQPAALMALRLAPLGKGKPIDLFTSRQGRFTSAPLPPGRYWLTLPGEANPLKQLDIAEGQSGMMDLGILSMPPERP